MKKIYTDQSNVIVFIRADWLRDNNFDHMTLLWLAKNLLLNAMP